MAILIVDDETKTRESLRDILTELGYKVILEAKNGEEALKTLDAEKTRVEMIVADWEMPYMDGLTLVKKVAEREVLDLTPFLLITSDLPKAKLSAFRKENPRLDACLIKPFRMAGLAEALHEAHLQRSLSRHTMLYLSQEDPAPIQEAMKKKPDPQWTDLKAVSSFKDLQTEVEKNARTLGAILLDPRQVTDGEWFTTFKKTPVGISTLLVCLSRNPEEVLPLRTLGQFFVERGANLKRWTEILNQMKIRIETSWEVDLLFPDLRALVQKKQMDQALKLCKKILQIDEDNSDAQTQMGEILEALGKKKEAREHFQKSIAIHPCIPRSYIRLIDITPASEKETRTELATQSVAFCPHNSDILLLAAKIWKSVGDLNQAKSLAEKILQAHPSHEAAREFIAALSQPSAST